MIDITIAAAERLRTQAGDVLRLVGTVADFEALAAMPRSVPAAYVLPLAEQAGDAEGLGFMAQMHRCTLGVLLFVRHAGDTSGLRSAAALHELREAVQAALVGWQPANTSTHTHTPAAFTAGELIQAESGTTVWRDDFEIARYVGRAA